MSNTTLRVGCCYACGGALGNPIQYVDGLAFHSWCVPSAPTMSSLEAQRDTAQHWLKAEQEITKQLRERIAALEAELKEIAYADMTRDLQRNARILREKARAALAGRGK